VRLESKKKRSSLVALLGAVLLIGGCSPGTSEETSGEPSSELPSSSVADAQQSVFSEPVVTLPEGTVLTARLVPTLSTGTHDVEDSFEATLAEPVTLDGQTMAPAGTRLWGKVVEADKGGRVEGRAHLAIQLTHIETAYGEPVGISTDPVRRNAPATKTDDAKKIGIGAGVGAAIGAIAGGGKGAAIGAAAGGGAGTGAVLATRGKPAVMPSETLLQFTLRHAVTIL